MPPVLPEWESGCWKRKHCFGKRSGCQPAKEEQLVLDPGAANGEPCELVVRAWRLGQTVGAGADAVRAGSANVRVLLEVGQRIQDRVVLCAENAAMPGIGAGLGDDVYH